VTRRDLKRRLAALLRRALDWGRHVPPGVRSVLGILLVAAGFVGFLPILGFWMAPVGAVLIALDIPPLRRRLSRWIERQEETPAAAPKTISARNGST
jgi:hypothetical protein